MHFRLFPLILIADFFCKKYSTQIVRLDKPNGELALNQIISIIENNNMKSTKGRDWFRGKGIYALFRPSNMPVAVFLLVN